MKQTTPENTVEIKNVALVRHIQLLTTPTNSANAGEVGEAWQSLAKPGKARNFKISGVIRPAASQLHHGFQFPSSLTSVIKTL